MPEQAFDIEPFGVDWICDCGLTMEHRGDVDWSARPLMFSHECANGHRIDLEEKYPTVRWRRKQR